MRICLVLEHFDPPRGGLEQWSWQFATELAARGHEVHVVAQDFGVSTCDAPIIAHRLLGIRSRLDFAEAAKAELIRLSPDVIHDMGFGWHCDVFQPHGGCWATLAEQKLLQVPPWMRLVKRGVDRVLPRQREFRTLLRRQFADNGQILIALSQKVADGFRRIHGVPDQRIRVVYNGVDTDHFSPVAQQQYRAAVRRQLEISEETVLALIVACNFRLKGVATLLRAMSLLAGLGESVRLVVVGGRHLRPWQQMATRLGIDSLVDFVGIQAQTLPYYAAADFYVHPTFYDTCSLAVLEAAASGLPVITTHANGASEMLCHGVDSLLVSDPANFMELAWQMQTLLDPTYRRRIGAAARQTALRHTLDDNVSKILTVYDEVIRSRRGHTCLHGPHWEWASEKSRPIMGS